MRRLRSRLAASLIGVILVGSIGLLVLPAFAVSSDSWGPVSSSYNGIKRVTGWGTLFSENGQYATNKFSLRDDRADGNTVYGRTKMYLYHFDPWIGGNVWDTAGEKRTAEHSNTTKVYYHRWTYRSIDEKAKSASLACAQMGWPVPDSCSEPWAYAVIDIP